MSTIPMTINDVKNKILADMDETERRDAIVGETRNGDYIILTERRVIEVFQVHDTISAAEKSTEGTWETLEYTS